MEKKMFLTSPQVIAAVKTLEGGPPLPMRTLAGWAAAGIAAPSEGWDRKRGPTHARRYSLDDLARVRLVVKLRREGVSMPKVRVILAAVERELPDVLKAKPRNAALYVDGWRGVILRNPPRADVDLVSGQFLLPFADVWNGLTKAAEDARRVA